MPDAGLGAPSALQVRAPELDDITPNATCVKMTHPISSKPPKKDTEWQKKTQNNANSHGFHEYPVKVLSARGGLEPLWSDA